MTPAVYNRFKSMLTKSIERHIKKGGKIINGSFEDDTQGGCCPIACVVGHQANQNYFKPLIKKLRAKVDERDFWNFIDGFDNNAIIKPETKKTQLYKLGQSLRKKYIANQQGKVE